MRLPHLTRLPRLPHLTRLTRLTRLTHLTHLTRCRQPCDATRRLQQPPSCTACGLLEPGSVAA